MISIATELFYISTWPKIWLKVYQKLREKEALFLRFFSFIDYTYNLEIKVQMYIR